MMASTSRVGVDRAPTGKAHHWQPPMKLLHVKVPHFDIIWGRCLGVCQRHMPNFLPPPAYPLLRKFAPKIRPKMGSGAWRWRGAQWRKSCFGAVFVHAGLEKISPPAGPLWPGGPAPPPVPVAGAPRPWDVARRPRDERGALVPGRTSSIARTSRQPQSCKGEPNIVKCKCR